MTFEEIEGIDPWDLTISQIGWLINRVKELEEGINRHKESLTQPIKESYVGCREDNDLYKLLEKGGRMEKKVVSKPTPLICPICNTNLRPSLGYGPGYWVCECIQITQIVGPKERKEWVDKVEAKL